MVEYDKDMKAAAKDTPERALKLGVCTTDVHVSPASCQQVFPTYAQN